MGRNVKLLLGVVVALVPLACYGQVAGSECPVRLLKGTCVPEWTIRNPYIPPLNPPGSVALTEPFRVSSENLKVFLPHESAQAHRRPGNAAPIPMLNSVGIGGLATSWSSLPQHDSQAGQALAWQREYPPFNVPAKWSLTTLTERCNHFGTSVMTRIKAAVTFGESRRVNRVTLVTAPPEPDASIQNDSLDGMVARQALTLNWRVD